jgi:hypothetical protein
MPADTVFESEGQVSGRAPARLGLGAYRDGTAHSKNNSDAGFKPAL